MREVGKNVDIHKAVTAAWSIDVFLESVPRRSIACVCVQMGALSMPELSTRLAVASMIRVVAGRALASQGLA